MQSIRIVSGESMVYRILARPANIVVPASACNAMDGFVEDHFSEYRNPSVVRARLHRQNGVPSLLQIHNSFAGSYYLGVAMLDSAAGAEPFELWLGNRKLAEARAEANDQRVHLFACPERLSLRRGEVFRLLTGANAYPYRIEAIVLLKRLPPQTAPPPAPALRLPPARRARPAQRWRIPLTILGRSGVHARSFPLTVGIPFPASRLTTTERVALTDARGRAVPLQVRAHARWPDGSVQWLIVDFQHDVGPADAMVWLTCGQAVPPRAAEADLARETARASASRPGPSACWCPGRLRSFPALSGLSGRPPGL